jgi:hypothetical protein
MPGRGRGRGRGNANNAKPKKQNKKAFLPRNSVSMNPLGKPNSYDYTRSYDYPVQVGKADAPNLVYMNTDNKYMIIKLHTKMSNMPDFVSDFNALYNQCQITSIHHSLIPNFKTNLGWQGTSGAANSNGLHAIPNYQIFFLPENFTVDQLGLASTTGDAIDSIINQTQRKASVVIPGKPMTFWNKRPSLVNNDIVADKGSSTNITSEMVRAGYLNINDHKDTTHYGLQLVIRRVDGQPIQNQSQIDEQFGIMGWRIQNQVFFRTRRVQ